jgi:cytidyltransferase-like protein
MLRIYAKGVFDLIHFGHVRFFRDAKNFGDHLTVGVSPDERAAAMKRKPIFSATHRAEVVRSIRYVDEVILNGPLSITREFMHENKFDLYIFGAASLAEKEIRLKECIDLSSEMIIELPYTRGVSTTQILASSL